MLVYVSYAVRTKILTHLIRLPGVDILVYDGRDGSISAKRAHGAAAAPVAVDVLDQDILGRRLYSDALVFVRHHDIVYPAISAGDIDAVETTPITPTDRHVVGFTVRTIVNDEVEHGRVNEDHVVNREVG
jgi:hypothetical protein